MEEKLLVITPPNRPVRLRPGWIPAHPVYRIGNGRLLRMERANPRGGTMVVEVGGVGGTDARAVCRQIVRECAVCGFGGVICAGNAPRGFAGILDEVLAGQGIALYVPEACGADTRRARVLIGSALSGGSLTCRLREAAERFGGPERVALLVERVAEDFVLPAPSGCGKSLTGKELAALMSRINPAVFFSDELCARYFTYMTPKGGAHFVLFDDATTIRKKNCSWPGGWGFTMWWPGLNRWRIWCRVNETRPCRQRRQGRVVLALRSGLW